MLILELLEFVDVVDELGARAYQLCTSNIKEWNGQLNN
jgi:hypothetical protein